MLELTLAGNLEYLTAPVYITALNTMRLTHTHTIWKLHCVLNLTITREGFISLMQCTVYHTMWFHLVTWNRSYEHNLPSRVLVDIINHMLKFGPEKL
jgi:hypothetical protein